MDASSVRRLARNVALACALASAAWILLSGWALARWFPSLLPGALLQTLKGWGFVLATGLLLYALLRYGLQDLLASESCLQESHDALREALEQLRAHAVALERRDAERMGGRAGVESEPGRGSRFRIELPGEETA